LFTYFQVLTDGVERRFPNSRGQATHKDGPGQPAGTKAASEINNSTLMKMGFHKEENGWIFRRNAAHRDEHEASNHGDGEEENARMHREDETVQAAEASFHRMHHLSSHRVESPALPFVQHMDESPIHSFMNEDVAATNYNALVVYQAPEYRGEPLSMFERQVLDKLDTLTDDQKTYFEMTQARFQHLDYQIEGVQEQLAELYYKHV